MCAEVGADAIRKRGEWMRTKEFIETHCKYRCHLFDKKQGCDAYAGEECDAAFLHPTWRGLTMRQRVDDYCEEHGNLKESEVTA